MPIITNHEKIKEIPASLVVPLLANAAQITVITRIITTTIAFLLINRGY
jgi:hypothetical protein